MTVPSANNCDTWFAVGLASSFSNITTDTARPLATYIPRSASDGLGCKVFSVQDEDGDTQVAVQMPLDVNDQIKSFTHKREQILVFQYNGKFHAIDNVRLTL
jgi:nitrite reductase/ring-hydroxylating ferredoxin subunit